ncbi:MAG: hypothetical protein H7296_11195 [Bacteroidia bacterium]|nr:hypothetical protein [Bacteroidia bacterium]
MQKLIYLSLIAYFLTAACKKDKFISANKTLPFENDKLKLELVTASAPSFIRDIFFFNSETGVAVSYDGKIYKTTDNGLSWSMKYTNPTANQPFYQILFTNATVGYVVGGSNSCGGTGCVPPGGLILKTTDGGETWATILRSPSIEFISIATNSLGHLFVISNGTKGRIHKSSNAGINWLTIDSVNFYLQKINFNGGFGFCTGTNGKIIRSSDTGTTWILTTTLTANYATDIKFINGDGYCIADNQTVYKTTDNGNNWSQILNHQSGSYVLNPLTANTCLVFSAAAYSGGCFGNWSGKIIQTTNGGANWTETEINEIEPIRYTSFYSATEGYAAAGNKLIKITIK